MLELIFLIAPRGAVSISAIGTCLVLVDVDVD
jgi:hypothetical protein